MGTRMHMPPLPALGDACQPSLGSIMSLDNYSCSSNQLQLKLYNSANIAKVLIRRFSADTSKLATSLPCTRIIFAESQMCRSEFHCRYNMSPQRQRCYLCRQPSVFMPTYYLSSSDCPSGVSLLLMRLKDILPVTLFLSLDERSYTILCILCMNIDGTLMVHINFQNRY